MAAVAPEFVEKIPVNVENERPYLSKTLIDKQLQNLSKTGTKTRICRRFTEMGGDLTIVVENTPEDVENIPRICR